MLELDILGKFEGKEAVFHIECSKEVYTETTYFSGIPRDHEIYEIIFHNTWVEVDEQSKLIEIKGDKILNFFDYDVLRKNYIEMEG